MLDTLLTTLRDEFVEFAEPADFVRASFRVTFAVLLAAVVGYEREKSGSTAGLRTHMLVALGVTLIIVAAQQADIAPADLTRVLQGVYTGIGFIGAGAILKQSGKDQVRGLTTAASIWATAAIASAVALGQGLTAVFATAVVYAILSVLLRWEKRFEKNDETAIRSSEDPEP